MAVIHQKISYIGLSTDTKPTDIVPVGSEYFEWDTGSTYIFNPGLVWSVKVRAVDLKPVVAAIPFLYDMGRGAVQGSVLWSINNRQSDIGSHEVDVLVYQVPSGKILNVASYLVSSYCKTDNGVFYSIKKNNDFIETISMPSGAFSDKFDGPIRVSAGERIRLCASTESTNAKCSCSMRGWLENV